MDCLNNEQALNSQLTSNSDSISNTLNSGDVVSSTLDTTDRITSTLLSNDNTTSQMGNEDPLNSALDQPTTHKYVGGSTDNIIVEVDNVGRIITATLKPIRFKTVADFPVVGSDKLIYIDASNNSLYSWDSATQTYSQLVAGGGGGESYDDTEIRGLITDLQKDKADKTDLNNYYTKSQTYTKQEVDTAISNVEVDLSGYYTKTETDAVATQTLGSAKGYTDTKVAELIDSAPETLDTFKEIADAFKENDAVLDALNSAIGLKADKSELSNYVTNTELENKKYATKSEVSGKVSLTTDEEIRGVKTFMDTPEIFRSQNDNAFSGNQVVPARFVEARLAEEKLVPGNSTITIEGNKITANLEGFASIVTLTSPVTISTLASGVYQLPANCELYLYSGASVNYNNTSPATLNVQVMTESNIEKRLFVLFAEAKGKTQKEIGTNGSFIVGKVGSASGNYHIVGTNNSYVLKNEDDTIYGNKTFDKATKYSSGVSLATTLNDKTLVDAQWVNAVLASKGYLTGVPSEYVTETELALRAYVTQSTLNKTDLKVAQNASAIKGLEENKLNKDDAVFMPVGSIFSSAIPQTDARVHLLDGSTISQSGMYAEFATLLKSLTSKYAISCSAGAYESDLANFGQCGKFVIDNVAGTIRLPTITKFIEGMTSLANIGQSFGAGLPNITGQPAVATWWTTDNDVQGAFTTNGNRDICTNNATAQNLVFDASKSNPIYGNSNTVQPQSTAYPYYIVLAGGYKSAEQVNIDGVANDINTNANSIANLKTAVQTNMLGIPSNSNYVNIAWSGSTFTYYTAPANGYVAIKAVGQWADNLLRIRTFTNSSMSTLKFEVASQYNGTYYDSGCMCPVKKGDYIEFLPMNVTQLVMQFVPAEGV